MTLIPPIRTSSGARAVTYVRVSTEDQVKGTSLDHQEQDCVDRLRAERIEVVRSFRDKGVSAKTADRAGLMEALDFTLDRKNGINVFMVWKVDRLARNTEDHFAIRRLLRSAGIELQSATEPIGDDPSSKLFEVMVAGFAEFDNSIRRMRCVNGMRARIRGGIWPFCAPPGYRNRSLARSGTKKTDPDPIDPQVFPLLQRQLKAYARGLCTQSDILRELRRGDFERLSGTKATKQWVDRFLSDYLPFYAGWLRDAFAEPVEYHRGRHEPMITNEEYHAIQARRAQSPRAGLVKLRANPDFPLKSILRCEDCGHRLTGSRPRGHGGRYAYYHCYNRSISHQRPSFPAEEVERAFAEHLRSLKPRPELLRALAASIRECWAQLQDAAQAAATLRESEERELDERRTRICKLAEEGVYSSEVAKERLAAIDQEISTLGLDSEALFDDTDPEMAVNEAIDVIDRLTADWLAFAPDIRERFERIAFPGGFSYSPDKGFSNLEISSVFASDSMLADKVSTEVGPKGLCSNQMLGDLRAFAALRPLLDDALTSLKSG